MTRAAKVVVVSVVLVVVAVVAVATVIWWPHTTRDRQAAVVDEPAPGTVLNSMRINDLPESMMLMRARGEYVTYASTDTAGKSTRVTGVLYAPGVPPPTGSWPVIALGHGSLGIDEPCAPSLSNSVSGLLPFIEALVAGGYAVAVPDFQGLGSPGVHPYLDNQTTGRNIIDAVRAARTVFGNLSDRWAGYGTSQGGGSTWSANEQSASYAPELRLVGTVNAAPTADIAGLLDKARAGTLTADQGPALQWAIEAAARAHPDIDRDDYRRGSAARNWDALSACSQQMLPRRRAAMTALRSSELAPATDAAYTRLETLLASYTVARQRASAPMLVLYGSEDTYVDPGWTTAAVRRACTLGDTVEADEQQGRGHFDLDITPALQWIVDRFAGRPAPTTCR